MSREDKLRELQELQAQVRRVESDLAHEDAPGQWPPPNYYTAYHALAGFVLGMFGAAASLLFNVVGSLLTGQEPLKIIRTYLTFPLGESAFQAKNDGLMLAVGCCLYLATGMVYGMIFQLILTRFFPRATFATRFVVITVLSLLLWVVNFYGILSWLQPLLFGGNWIVRDIPPWVGALTHLVFGWTMLLVQPWGTFVPYGVNTGVKTEGS